MTSFRHDLESQNLWLESISSKKNEIHLKQNIFSIDVYVIVKAIIYDHAFLAIIIIRQNENPFYIIIYCRLLQHIV